MTNVSNEQMVEVALGWVKSNAYSKIDGTPITGPTYFIMPNGDNSSTVPDITHDLNLVHEIENTLTDAEWLKYIANLTNILDPNFIWRYEFKTFFINKRLCNATAQQKCNALFSILLARKEREG